MAAKVIRPGVLPETVKQEVLPGKDAPGENAINQAIDEGWVTV
ncbi:hypothetical protein [Methylomonas rapida]|uniref:Uncharacterized protein n=1 Tax=Methylomonas rapida TaxID=2963939 RepID=A0ABY7GHB9_9GAMM|nr:hypothetical protein [Methylomonas rapida]WAR44652.1 hypothetical protein NM686_020250 [Methylomonas rapida]